MRSAASVAPALGGGSRGQAAQGKARRAPARRGSALLTGPVPAPSPALAVALCLRPPALRSEGWEVHCSNLGHLVTRNGLPLKLIQERGFTVQRASGGGAGKPSGALQRPLTVSRALVFPVLCAGAWLPGTDCSGQPSVQPGGCGQSSVLGATWMNWHQPLQVQATRPGSPRGARGMQAEPRLPDVGRRILLRRVPE